MNYILIFNNTRPQLIQVMTEMLLEIAIQLIFTLKIAYVEVQMSAPWAMNETKIIGDCRASSSIVTLKISI